MKNWSGPPAEMLSGWPAEECDRHFSHMPAIGFVPGCGRCFEEEQGEGVFEMPILLKQPQLNFDSLPPLDEHGNPPGPEVQIISWRLILEGRAWEFLGIRKRW